MSDAPSTDKPRQRAILNRKKPEASPTKGPSHPPKKEKPPAETKHLKKALAALPQDFLFPTKRCWIRLNVALNHWLSLDRTRSQGTLCANNKVLLATLGRALSPDGLRKTNGTIDEHLAKLALLLEVKEQWLLKGYADSGEDVWPEWTADATREGRSLLHRVLIAYLEAARDGSIAPPIVADILRPFVKVNKQDSTELIVPRQEHVAADTRWRKLRAFIIREQLTVNEYLSRHRDVLQAEFGRLRNAEPLRVPSDLRRFGRKTIDDLMPEIPIQQWIKTITAPTQQKREVGPPYHVPYPVSGKLDS